VLLLSLRGDNCSAHRIRLCQQSDAIALFSGSTCQTMQNVSVLKNDGSGEE
jgi:hypothetical protein